MRGIDVSNNNGHVDWAKVKNNGYQFAIVKISEGVNFKDRFAAENIAGARAQGMIVGGYHFARPDVNAPDNEAHHFVASLPGMTPQFLVLDIETGDHGIAAWAEAFLANVEQQTGSLPWLYTGLSYAQTHLKVPRLARYPLWLAAYRAVPPPAPPPWQRWSIWQFTSSGKVAGVPGRCDVNVTNNDSVFDRYTGKDDEVNQADKDEIVRRVADEVVGTIMTKLTNMGHDNYRVKARLGLPDSPPQGERITSIADEIAAKVHPS